MTGMKDTSSAAVEEAIANLFLNPKDVEAFCVVQEMIRDLVVQRDDLLKQSEWQPIETAPKDGSEVDLWHKRGFRMVDMRWFFSSPRHPNGGWAEETPNDFYEYASTDFTHWMPLPEPPVVAEQEGA